MPPPVTTLALRPPSGQALDLAGPWMPRPVTAVAKLTHEDGAVYEVRGERERREKRMRERGAGRGGRGP